MDSTVAVLVGSGTATLAALAALWQATSAARQTRANGCGSVPEMLEHLVKWSGSVDERLDRLEDRLS